MPPTMFTKAGSSESVSNSNRLTWLTKMGGFCRSGGAACKECVAEPFKSGLEKKSASAAH